MHGQSTTFARSFTLIGGFGIAAFQNVIQAETRSIPFDITIQMRQQWNSKQKWRINDDNTIQRKLANYREYSTGLCGTQVDFQRAYTSSAISLSSVTIESSPAFLLITISRMVRLQKIDFLIVYDNSRENFRAWHSQPFVLIQKYYSMADFFLKHPTQGMSAAFTDVDC